MKVMFLTAAVLAARSRDRLGLSVGVLVGLVALALALVGTVAAAGPLSLAPTINYGAHTGPFDVAAGDLNRDGKPDLVVANVVGRRLGAARQRRRQLPEGDQFQRSRPPDLSGGW